MSEPSFSRARLENILIFIKLTEHLLEQNLPKSINRSAAKYPSPPGVEGAPARSARKTRALHTPEACNRKDGQTAPKPKSPKVRTDELIDEVVYRPN